MSIVFDGGNLEAEKSVITGVVMAGPKAIEAVSEIITSPNMFSSKDYRIVFTAVKELYDDGKPVDSIAVLSHLRTKGEAEKIGGAFFFTDLNDVFVGTANLTYHAQIVKICYLSHIIREMSAGLLSATQSVDAPTIVDLSSKIYDTSLMFLDDSAGRTNNLVDIFSDMIKEIEGGDDKAIKTHVGPIDDIIGGFYESEFSIIGARPGMGKTSLAVTFLMNIAETFQISDNGKAGLISIEMPAKQIAMRMLSVASGIPVTCIRRGDLTMSDWSLVAKCIDRIVKMPIIIDDDVNTTIYNVESKIKKMIKDGCKIVFIDYLQLIVSHGRTKEEEVSKISGILKLLSRKYKIPIVALSQLSRPEKGSSVKRPTLSDLRNSGALEQDAVMVMFIHRPEYYGVMVDDDGVPTNGMAEIIVGKQRNGPTGVQRINFDAVTTKFS